MLAQQQKYLDFLQRTKQEISHIDGLDSKEFKLDELSDIIAKTELLIPIIGAFSAGKSSLLNSFLQKPYLSVGIRPETALATELRYSNDEYIELIKNDGSIEKLGILDTEIVKEKAKEAKFARYYINQRILKDIEPLIIVDMPGFESPLDSHNKAIFEYLQKGVYFIALQNIEDGNITKSMIRQLENILTLNRDFAFFLSKVNLKSESSVKETSKLMKEQLESYLDVQKNINTIDNNGGENLKVIIAQINPESIIKQLYENILRDTLSDIKQNINTKIKALSNSGKENAQAIQTLQDSLTKLENEKNAMQQNVQNRYGSNGVNRIVENIGRILSNNADEIAQAYQQNEQNGEMVLNSIANNAIIQSVQEALDEVSRNISEEFREKLSNINPIMQNFTLDSNWTQNQGSILEKIAFMGDKIGTAGKIIFARGNTIGIVVGTALVVIGEIIQIAKTLSQLFGKSETQKKQEQLDKIKNEILIAVIPRIKSNLRQELPSKFNEEVAKIINEIGQGFESKITTITRNLEQTQIEKEKANLDIQKTIQLYQEILHRLDSLANQTLF